MPTTQAKVTKTDWKTQQQKGVKVTVATYMCIYMYFPSICPFLWALGSVKDELLELLVLIVVTREIGIVY